MRKQAGLLMAFCMLLPIVTIAAERTVVLSIPTMDCATCPVTIRIALLKTQGVSAAKVSYKHREARVTFDDALTTVDALRAATRDVGYPAILK